MRTYDVEELLEDIEALLKSKLNTKIAAIEAEKIAAGLATTGLKAVESNAYFQQSWSDKILNCNPALFYGLESVEAQGSGTATAEKYTIFVEVIIPDSGMDTLAKNRVHRYARALKEVFQENSNALTGCAQINIKTIQPFSFKIDENSSEEMKVGGVSITTAIA